jgi:Zn-dependent peptidase ImmA (M78 family)/DNA-binding XRE family transcriptional regulator
VIGNRLKLARAAAGLSLRGLADRAEGLVSAQAIGKYERDEMMPSSDVLTALARALKVTEGYLLSPSGVTLSSVEFRTRKLKVREAAEVEARILSVVERYLQVERILGLEYDDGLGAAERPEVATAEGAEDAAISLRAHWNLGDDPIPDLCEFLEEQGVKIVAVDMPSKVSGMQAAVLAGDGQRFQVIAVNSVHPGERQRFTIAHELGHLFLRCGGELDAERGCNRFAGAFLVPRAMLLREVGEHRSSISVGELFQLKHRFGVSAQALVYRCRDLGVLSESAAGAIFRNFSMRGWRQQEPLELAAERPRRFERLCLRAVAEGCVSESKAAELLGVRLRELADLLDQPPAEETTGGRSSRL